MVSISPTLSDQDRRIRFKNQDQLMIVRAMEGAGLSRWEAGVLPDLVKELYFGHPTDRPLRTGQMRYECVAEGEGAGKPIDRPDRRHLDRGGGHLPGSVSRVCAQTGVPTPVDGDLPLRRHALRCDGRQKRGEFASPEVERRREEAMKRQLSHLANTYEPQIHKTFEGALLAYFASEFPQMSGEPPART